MHSPMSIIFFFISTLTFIFTASLPMTVSGAAIAIPMANSHGIELSGRQGMVEQICCSDDCKTCGLTACSTKTCLDHPLFTTCCAAIASGKRNVDGQKQYVNTKGEVIEFVGSVSGEENEDQIEGGVSHRINWKKSTVVGEKNEVGNSEGETQDEEEISHRINWKKSNVAREENGVGNGESGAQDGSVSHRINWKKWTGVGEESEVGNRKGEALDEGGISNRINWKKWVGI